MYAGRGHALPRDEQQARQRGTGGPGASKHCRNRARKPTGRVVADAGARAPQVSSSPLSLRAETKRTIARCAWPRCQACSLQGPKRKNAGHRTAQKGPQALPPGNCLCQRMAQRHSAWRKATSFKQTERRLCGSVAYAAGSPNCDADRHCSARAKEKRQAQTANELSYGGGG